MCLWYIFIKMAVSAFNRGMDWVTPTSELDYASRNHKDGKLQEGPLPHQALLRSPITVTGARPISQGPLTRQ